MLTTLIPIEETLYVFGAWTLMIQTKFAMELKLGQEIFMLNEANQKIGKARLHKILSSKNSDITPFEITIIGSLSDLKEVSHIKTII